MGRQIDFEFAQIFPSGMRIEASLRRPLPAASVLVLFGPSGAGKTTILRALAGLLRPVTGRIAFDDHVWFDGTTGQFVPPQLRRIGYVAQETALFPHLTVADNIGFALRRLPSQERRRRVNELMTTTGVSAFEGRFPNALSGGQSQRVALARALAPKPDLLLLDEPFGALDADIRRALRADLRRMLERSGASAVVVTHDRHEALAIGDDLAIVVGGRVHQVDGVAEVFHRPADLEVARSLGVETVLPAVVEHSRGGLLTLRVGAGRLVAVEQAGTIVNVGEQVYACVRAADVVLDAGTPSSDSARNHLNGVVSRIESEGVVDRITIDCGFDLVAAVTARSRHELGLSIGSLTVAVVKATAIHVVAKA